MRIILFTDKKIFVVSLPRNPQNDRIYAVAVTGVAEMPLLIIPNIHLAAYGVGKLNQSIPVH